MATNLHLDDKLIRAAQRAGKHRTKREAVNAALEAYVRQQQINELIAAFGTVDFDPDWDYKAERRLR